MDEANGACALSEYAERVRAIVRELAERTGLSIEEAAGYISKAIQGIKESVTTAVDELTRLFEQFEESGFFDMEPRAHRRKAERERARVAEQIYRTKIKRFERTRPFRRIYKPP